MKRAGALAATVVILIVMIKAGRTRDDRPTASAAGAVAAGASAKSASPVDQLERFLADARRGDVPAYLRSLGGALLDRVQREVDEVGEETFAERLRQAGRASLSHAVFAPEPAGQGDGVAITVDSIQADRQARSVYRLEPSGSGWRIVAVDRTQELFPKSAKGSVATYTEPEANPMSGAEEIDSMAQGASP